MTDYWERLFYGIVLFCVMMGMGLLVKTIDAPGTVTYCYVTVDEGGHFPLYALKGNVEWRPDREIGYLTNELVKFKENTNEYTIKT